MTLPAIVQKNQKTVAVTRLKKYYTMTLQAVNKAQAETDPDGIVIRSYLENYSEAEKEVIINYFTDNYIKPNFKIIKDFGFVTPKNAGMPNYKSLNGTIDGDANNFYSKDIRILELADGAICYIWCGGNDTMQSFYLIMQFDINGKQRPNVIGQDVFCMVLFFNNNSVKFFTLDKQKNRNDYLTTCNKSAGTIDSRTCGALIQSDGWEMKEDYPW